MIPPRMPLPIPLEVGAGAWVGAGLDGAPMLGDADLELDLDRLAPPPPLLGI